MISCFLKEQKRYTQGELAGLFKLTDAELVPILRRLKALGVLKALNAATAPKDFTELTEEDIDVSEVVAHDDARDYVFTFVGILVISGRILKCYPKYLSAKAPSVETLKQILRVLEKYQKSEAQHLTVFEESAEIGQFHFLSLLFALLQDYFEHGLYTHTQDLIEDNGRGEILWERTINTTTAYFNRGEPYYLETKTKRRSLDDANLITQLHKVVLTQASRLLREAELLEFFDLTEVDLTEETLENLGSDEALVSLLENELRSQFNTRKQWVLQSLIAYLTQARSEHSFGDVLFFGTTCFYHVWEVVCATTLDNQLPKPLRDLPLPERPEGESLQGRLLDLIEKPLWSATQTRAQSTLIPDIVSLSGTQFIIIDAKYYTPKLELGKVPEGQPGIESITKQYLYQLAYQPFIEQHGFKTVRNCFVMPTDSPEVEKRGEVRLDMFTQMGLAPIEVRFLPAHWVFELYLKGEKIALEALDL